MIQLILHGIGDYFIQTDTWATNKKNKGRFGLWCCFIHCLTYSLPFLFIGSPLAVLAIFVTHFAIDRTHWLEYALAWKNKVYEIKNGTFKIVDGIEQTITPYSKTLNISNFGFGLNRPPFITIWLYIITDNLCHIICNYIALKYL